MRRRVYLSYLSMLCVCGLALVGCTTNRHVDETIAQTSKGSVTLERIPDLHFQAAHPIALNRDIITRSLAGLLIVDRQDMLHTLVGGKPTPSPVFAQEDLTFLVPLISEGLAKAAPDQQVGFRVLQKGSPTYSQRTGAGVGSSEPPLTLSPEEITSGHLYAYGRSLYLNLSEVHHRQERPDTIHMANRRLPDSSGLVGRDVSFAPQIAIRSEAVPPFSQDNAATTFAIDYELLMKLPASIGRDAAPSPPPAGQPAGGQAGPLDTQSAPAPTAHSDADGLDALREQMKKKDNELEELRKELGDIKRQLDRQAERSRKPNEKTPKAKPKDSIP